MGTYGIIDFNLTEEEMDISKIADRYTHRIGERFEHFTIIRPYGIRRERIVNSKTDKKYTRTTIFYEVQCNYVPEHKYIVRHTELTRGKDGRDRAVIRCACADRIHREKIFKKSNDKFTGMIVAGCECLRRSDNMVDRSIPIFVYRCAYCGKEFERRYDVMDAFEKKHPHVASGCEDCLVARHLMRKSQWTKDDIDKVAKKTLKTVVDRIYNPFDDNYYKYGGRGLTMDPQWDPYSGLYTPDECIQNMVNHMQTHDWAPGKEIERHVTNTGYLYDNCGWATRKEQNDNRRVTIYVEWRNRVYNSYEFRDMYQAAITDVWREVPPTTVRMKLYQLLHSKENILVRPNKDGTFRDQYGYVRMVPMIKIFPLYPDDKNPPVNNTAEYLHRLASNLKAGTPTRVTFSSKLAEQWITDDDLRSVGINNIMKYKDLLIML